MPPQIGRTLQNQDLLYALHQKLGYENLCLVQSFVIVSALATSRALFTVTMSVAFVAIVVAIVLVVATTLFGNRSTTPLNPMPGHQVTEK